MLLRTDAVVRCFQRSFVVPMKNRSLKGLWIIWLTVFFLSGKKISCWIFQNSLNHNEILLISFVFGVAAAIRGDRTNDFWNDLSGRLNVRPLSDLMIWHFEHCSVGGQFERETEEKYILYSKLSAAWSALRICNSTQMRKKRDVSLFSNHHYQLHKNINLSNLVYWLRLFLDDLDVVLICYFLLIPAFLVHLWQRTWYTRGEKNTDNQTYLLAVWKRQMPIFSRYQTKNIHVNLVYPAVIWMDWPFN